MGLFRKSYEDGIYLKVKKNHDNDEYYLKFTMDDIDRNDGVIFHEYIDAALRRFGLRTENWRLDMSGDHGADKIIMRGDEKIPVRTVYCKGTVSDAEAEKICNAKRHYETDDAWLFTNGTFSDRAKSVAEEAGATLMDRNVIEEIIEHLELKKEWSGYKCGGK